MFSRMQKNSKPRGGVRGKNKCQPIAYSKPVCKTKGGWLSVKFGHCRWYNVYMIQQHSGNMSQNMMESNGCASEYGGQEIYEPSILTQETLQRCGQENHIGFCLKDYGKTWATQQSNRLSSSFLQKCHFGVYHIFRHTQILNS